MFTIGSPAMTSYILYIHISYTKYTYILLPLNITYMSCIRLLNTTSSIVPLRF